jgi:hypothetical protein
VKKIRDRKTDSRLDWSPGTNLLSVNPAFEGFAPERRIPKSLEAI